MAVVFSACSPCPGNPDFFAAGACVSAHGFDKETTKERLEAAAYSVESAYNEIMPVHLSGNNNLRHRDLDIWDLNASIPFFVEVVKDSKLTYGVAVMNHKRMQLAGDHPCPVFVRNAAHEWVHAIQEHHDGLGSKARKLHGGPHYGQGGILETALGRASSVCD